ncbi:uncharacterized protein KQ657_004231 [Scheffersomyces spartinae]|uniref:Transcriptional regulator n=1 Tax=Scheffersomyces spartinae TaxID=45513 RepID=A0A9P7VBA7_9ASCO|nr:uncharacterized protein KQ657_004231 [Scheffersomyces spartinae]KAG7194560.1 hypothetical protein KQ657_004231 [Scheffersomyces spartinae]
MYIPKKYLEEDWEQVEYLIKTYPLATIITHDANEGIIANHIPLVLQKDSESGETYLCAHVAKTNHQLPSLKENPSVLIIFQSSNSYVSPSYYPQKKIDHKVVPTWDFAAVHIDASSQVVDDGDFVRKQLEALSSQQEAKRDEPWSVKDAPEKYTQLLQKAITGVQFKINTFQCKYKFEQAMGKDNVDGVVKGFAQDGLTEQSDLVLVSNQRFERRKAATK